MSTEITHTQDDLASLKEEVTSLKGILLKTVTELRALSIQKYQSMPEPWIDLKTACAMKGVKYSSLTAGSQSWRRPNNGSPDAVLNGRDHWRPETIRSWIMKDDEELAREHALRNS
jgi:hypothetical protein